MNDEQMQELLKSWRERIYLEYYQVLRLLTGFFPDRDIQFAKKESFPERIDSIKQMLEEDFQKFKLKVYFEEMQDGYGGTIPLFEPKYPTKYEELQCYVDREERAACYWLFGKLSAQELKDWLQSKGIATAFFETTTSPTQGSSDDNLLEHPDEPAAVSETSSQRQTPQQPEITQEDAEILPGVETCPIPATDETQIEAEPVAAPLPLPPIKKRVSTSGSGNAQVRYTCQENQEAAGYIEIRRGQGAPSEEIARELVTAGGGVGVIGCLMQPTCEDVQKARDHGKYLLEKAKNR